MSALSRAHVSLTNAVAELEEAIGEAPSYSVESLSFLKAELREVVRHLENARKVIEHAGGQPG